MSPSKISEGEPQVELVHKRPKPGTSMPRVSHQTRYYKREAKGDGLRESCAGATGHGKFVRNEKETRESLLKSKKNFGHFKRATFAGRQRVANTTAKYSGAEAIVREASLKKPFQEPLKGKRNIKQYEHSHNTNKATFPGSKSHPRVSVENKDRSYNIYSLSFKEIFSLCSEDSESIVSTLHAKIKAFQKTLQEAQKVKEVKVMDALVLVLSKVAKCLQDFASESSSQASLILGEALSERCHAFQVHLKLYVSRELTSRGNHPVQYMPQYTTKARVERVLELFRILLSSLPDSSWSRLPILELHQGICRLNSTGYGEINADHEQQAKQLVEHVNEITKEKCRLSTASAKEAAADSQDNSEYRRVSILPQWQEISSLNRMHHLRPNIIHGHYSDWLHYYSIHFHLLREDFIAPLRRGICCFLQGARGRKLQDVKAYEHVRITEPVISSDGVSYELRFDIRHLKRCKWEHSKRLLYGALLCLSPDNFKETILFATVSRREPDELRQGKVLVRFEGDDRVQMYISNHTSFCMVESLAYFEACRHTLLCLQQTEVDTMPFSQYILRNDCKSVSSPSYIARNPELCYNLSCLLKDTSIAAESGSEHEFVEEVSLSSLLSGIPSVATITQRQVKLLDEYQWPSLEEMELDSSQLEAIKMALTQEIAIIQGPPGAGKTYIGLKAVQVLLTNRKAWDPDKESPIIVMCLTNHALDQFLEGILALSDQEGNESIKPKIVRVGGRSKSEVIQNLNITKVAQGVYLPHHIRDEMYRCRNDVNNAATMVKMTRTKMLDFSKPSFFSLQELLHLEVISPQHYYQLGEALESPAELEKALEIWLGIYEITYQLLSASDSPSIEDNESTVKVSAAQEIKQTSTDISVPKNVMQETRMDSRSENQESKAIPDTDLSTQSAEQVEKNPTDKSNSDDETSDSDEEELIDVKGEASVEQEARLIGTQAQDWWRLNDFLEEKSNRVAYEPYNPITQEQQMLDDILNFVDNQAANDKASVKADDEAAKVLVKSVRSLHKCDNVNFLIATGRACGHMSRDEVALVQNINYLNPTNRWRLYNYWVSCCINDLSEYHENELDDYNRLCTRRKEAMQRADRYALETADIVGMTTTGACKYQHVLHLVKAKIIVVEEAAEVLESHIVAGLTAGTQHLILIGDHKQLRPKPNEYELARKYKLDISLFERLILNNFPHTTLQIQHRMRPEIAQLVKPHIYKTLINHESVEKYDNVMGVESNLYFIQHEFPEMEDENLISHSNQHEARFLTALCHYLLKQGYKPSQMTILVTYSGQLLLMRSYMPRDIFEGVRVCTVDNFQGEENDIILLSLVRSNTENKVGFLREENRVCVALSRAKMGFYCIGNFKMLRNNAPIWEAILSDMEGKNLIGEALPLHCTNHSDTRYEAKAPDDFKVFSPNGGCLKDCEYRLPCGHACELKCHIQDPKHKEYVCRKPCAKKCKEGHSCQNLCYERCQCMVSVVRTMPYCGHSQEMYCYEDPARVKCKNPCEKTCSNNHICPQLCHEYCRPCKMIMQKEMPKCGHTRPVECNRYSSFILCDADCDKKCDNGHHCLRKCHEPCGRCLVKIEKIIPFCGHTVLLACNSPPNHSLCTQQCERLLPCGHGCPLQCNEPCIFATCKVKVSVTLDCGHSLSIGCSESESMNRQLCEKPCQRTLPCGHKCTMKCGQPCTQQCKKKVVKCWPCGHELKRPCYQLLRQSDYPCDKKCKTTLPCGHSCPNMCGMPCADLCNVNVNRECPCGHSNIIPCFVKPADVKCIQRCKAVLSCGHRCDGQCSKCSTTRIHEPCKYHTDGVRFCGHHIRVPCQDVGDRHPGRKVCTASCAHVKCKHDCSVKCSPCDLPCAWNCPHFKCTKLCHELCDRPVCNRRCENELTCGHQCFGVCGEPCLNICPLCQRKKFNKKLKPATFSERKLYVQLPCDHILAVDFLDESVSGQSQTRRVLPILCPVNNCYHRIPTSYRYGNAAKEALRNIESVLEIIIDNERSATILEVSLASRMNTLLQGHVRIKQRFIGHWKNQDFYLDPTDGRLRQYDPFPRISFHLLSLEKRLSFPDHEHQYNIQGQEKFIIFLLLNVARLLNTVSDNKLKEISLAVIGESISVEKQLQFFACFVIRLWKERSSRLSHQTVIDLQSEIFRLYLLVQYCFFSRFHELDQPLSSTHYVVNLKTFLEDSAKNHMMTMTRHQFTQLATVGQLALKSVPGLFNYEQLLSDIDRSLPSVTKGDWWKCVNGHYHCTPFTMFGHDCMEPSCPHCV